ncbi:hypothetical protein DRE_06461 [Drechslerella stenobrocha 248]|uniref:Uncharacterized protein n=1 Tax=Drechslerella stenobrocha 248 TaxID=1043628 RepID=W7HY12_9PEZI|nr:hypothetical protein DRE_06461 [Drechslerella stenobrocha 248]
MESSDGISMAKLYHSHPHILTSILYECSPTTFDALRYTCKAIYSMSLDPGLLKHHLLTIVDSQRDILAAHTWGWRWNWLRPSDLSGASWRLGDYRKAVFTFAHDDTDPLSDDTTTISLGTVCGSTFAVVRADRQCTRIHSYYFDSTGTRTASQLHGPEGLAFTHGFDDNGTYTGSACVTRSVDGRKGRIAYYIEDLAAFDVSINECAYKRRPADSRMRTHGLGQQYATPNIEKFAATLLRVKFRGRDVAEAALAENMGEVDIACNLVWGPRRGAWWDIPAVGQDSQPSVVLPEHSEETMKVMVGRRGECVAQGYAAGLDDERSPEGGSERVRRWKILEPRRDEQDVSRLGMWKEINVEFACGGDGGETPAATLTVEGLVAKTLVHRPQNQTFLLSRAVATNPADWIRIQIDLVLPPTTHSEKRGKLKLASPAPAAFFRRLGMLDPEIPWPDPGIANPTWDASGTTLWTGEHVRVGCMVSMDLMDAEVMMRVVGWTDDGAVWVWDVNEWDILECARGAPVAEAGVPVVKSPVGRAEVAGKKLGYVPDVRAVAVTGDRLVQRVFLFTYGPERRVHRGGTVDGDSEGIDAGIAALRRDDVPRAVEEVDAQGGPDVKVEEREDEEEDIDRWRMVIYSFGEQKGKSGGFSLDSSGGTTCEW